MPLHRPRPRRDLDRVAWILADARGAADRANGGGREDAGRGVADEEPEQGAGGWVPRRPGSGSAADAELARLDADLRRARRPGLVTVPTEIASARRSTSGPAVLSLVALVVAAGCLFAVRVLWAERSSAGPVAAGRPSATLRVSDPSGVATSGETPTATVTGSAAATLVVHVVGRVKRPGLVRLPPGSRVADAIAAAGGARTGADLSALNLAQLVVDGEQVHVPAPGEVVAPLPGPDSASGSGSAPGALVDVNTADLATLDTLPGVGPVLAQRILDWRAEHGRFTAVDELGEVSGIGDKLLSQLRPRVTL
jgi:comEA protein